jgi:hypothetical protein
MALKDTTTMEKYEQEIEWKEEQSDSMAFEIQIPPESKRSYVGKYSEFYWLLDAKIDIPIDRDLNVRSKIEVF